MAVGQNQWYYFEVGAPPILVYFSGDWDVHWGYGILTLGHMLQGRACSGTYDLPEFQRPKLVAFVHLKGLFFYMASLGLRYSLF